MRLPAALALLTFVGAGSLPPAGMAAECFVLSPPAGSALVSDPAECAHRTAPASTFKIPHALIALDTGVITPETVVKWDGTKYDFVSWRRDHTLETAIGSSVYTSPLRTARQRPAAPALAGRPPRRKGMHVKTLSGLGALTLVAVLSGSSPVGAPLAAAAFDNGPELQSIGPLAFGADGTLFAADTKGATIFALDLGTKAGGTIAGAKSVDGIDAQIASLLGTDAKSITVTDMVVHPTTKNAYLSVMRGQGAEAKPALVRVDGAGKLDLVPLDGMKYTKVALPNAPNANPQARRDPRRDAITHMALVGNKLYVAGLSNEEFASKLRAIPYPFTSADKGTSVEIFHGNHGQLETRSPVYAFIPYQIGNEPYIIASYLCTPLVKFPVASLKGDAKVLGTTIAELGSGNQPIDMVLYKKGGHEFLLMANTSRGVMKIPTDGFATLPSITAKVATETAGIKYETIQQLKGIMQLDLLDANQSIVLAKSDAGVLSLQTVPLP